ncbi:MAG: hypothetical protein QOG11_1282, partial [Solirubrobacteraceae bacterium]|nr:hypothetical protein [Solirubrobacteraceae bacterium]
MPGAGPPAGTRPPAAVGASCGCIEAGGAGAAGGGAAVVVPLVAAGSFLFARPGVAGAPDPACDGLAGADDPVWPAGAGAERFGCAAAGLRPLAGDGPRPPAVDGRGESGPGDRPRALPEDEGP